MMKKYVVIAISVIGILFNSIVFADVKSECQALQEIFMHFAEIRNDGAITAEVDEEMIYWCTQQNEQYGVYYDELWEMHKIEMSQCVNICGGGIECFASCNKDWGLDCTTCVAGEFYNAEKDACEECEPSTYMDVENHLNTSCYECPSITIYGHTLYGETDAGGITDVTECFIRSPQYFSDSTGAYQIGFTQGYDCTYSN